MCPRLEFLSFEKAAPAAKAHPASQAGAKDSSLENAAEA